MQCYIEVNNVLFQGLTMFIYIICLFVKHKLVVLNFAPLQYSVDYKPLNSHHYKDYFPNVLIFVSTLSHFYFFKLYI